MTSRSQTGRRRGVATRRPEEPYTNSVRTVLWEPGRVTAPATRAAYPRAAPRGRGVPAHQAEVGSGDCDELEVMVALGLVRRPVAERGVQPPAVVELLDVLEDRAARLLVGRERALAQPLLLK